MSVDYARLRELFDAAVDLPPGERRAFAEANTPGQPDLRDELLAILDGSADSQFLMGTQPLGATAEHAADELPPDTQVGNYRLLREVGGGGMGIVYLAVRNDDVFRKTVALKVIRAGVGNPEFVERFRRERQILAGLDHPNIARILDGGDTPDGRPFYVMEYVDGQPIDDHCRRTAADVQAKIQLVIQVCEAVEYLHEHAVVHRDIKPANVLVTAGGRAKLIDLGIAGIQTAEGLIESPAAGKRTRLLTPGFASPEQLEGLPASKTSDIYSLGILLYNLLSGTFPFVDDTGEPSLARQLAGGDPKPPSASVSRKDTRSPSVLPDLDRVVLTAISRETSRRYGSVGALRLDLQRVLEGRPVTAHADTWTYRIGKAVRRNKALSALALALLLALGAATWFAVQLAWREFELSSKEATFSKVLAALNREVTRWEDPKYAVTDEHKAEVVKQTIGLLNEPTLKQVAASGRRSQLVSKVVSGVEDVLDRAERAAGPSPTVHKEIYRGLVIVGNFRATLATTSGRPPHEAVPTYKRAALVAKGLARSDEQWAREALRQLVERVLSLGLTVSSGASDWSVSDGSAAEAPPTGGLDGPSDANDHDGPKKPKAPGGPTGPARAESVDAERQRQLRSDVQVAKRLADSLRVELAQLGTQAGADREVTLWQADAFLGRASVEVEAGQLDEAEKTLAQVSALHLRIRRALGR